MNPIIPFANNNEFTFSNDRRCRYCNAPIADQKHASREFCQVTTNPDGSIADCKTDYHRQNDYGERESFRKLINEKKAVDERLQTLIARKGSTVTTADLNAYDIPLWEPCRFEIFKTGILITYFLSYRITTNPILKTHQIEKI